MKRIFIILSLVGFTATASMAQCNDGRSYKDLEVPCYKEFASPEYISDGQQYREFLTGGLQAEYTVTFYGGTTYRIVTCSDLADAPIVYSITDPKGNILFNNEQFENARVWDLEFKSTITCQLKFHFAGQEVEERGNIVDPNDTLPDSLKKETPEEKAAEEAKISGCASIIISFKQ
ncbi:MAG: hypothetical protein H6585_11965 [Flavobacteriales bacterium]|nr:hypothetical protein [Flavobacteriales bacterium]MCB9449046.1 hypothetical protein [Flavobacteriales bacterium]